MMKRVILIDYDVDAAMPRRVDIARAHDNDDVCRAQRLCLSLLCVMTLIIYHAKDYADRWRCYAAMLTLPILRCDDAR